MGVIAGPHPEFTKTERQSQFVHGTRCNYLTVPVQTYAYYISLIKEVPLLGYKEVPCLIHYQLQLQSELNSDVVGIVPETKQMSHAFVSRKPKALNSFEKLESTGINISYRCIGCRDCTKCINGALIENISVQEEEEQTLINESVTVDLENMADTRLLSNLNSAHKDL